MSHGNHRVFKENANDPLASENGDWFTIREVYYNDKGEIVAYTGAKDVCGDTIESLRTTLNWMLSALDEDTVVLVDDFEDDVEDDEEEE